MSVKAKTLMTNSKKMKNSILKLLAAIFSIVILAGCHTDDNEPLPETKIELSINSLNSITTNIPFAEYSDLTFVDKNTGYAIANSGKIVKTSDGGNNWVDISIPNSELFFKKIQFTDANNGFIIGQDNIGCYLIKTANAGHSWSVINLNIAPEKSMNGMYFINKQNGFITGDKFFIKTIDSGLTWTNVLNEEIKFTFNDINFQNTQTGIVTTNIGRIYKTTNSGDSWKFIEVTDNLVLQEVYFVDSKTYIKSGNKLIEINFNTSKTIPNGISKLLFLNSKNCIGIGQHYNDTGFLPYGDIFLTNDFWNASLQKTYDPQLALNFRAIAKMNDHNTLMIGNGHLYNTVIRIAY